MNNITFRHATEQDLDTIVQMLADDILGSRRERYEKPLPISYIRAFQAIQLDPNNELIVACKDEKIVGVQQITFTPYFVRQGSWRATIEGVRIASSERNQGVGRRLIEWAIQRAEERKCQLIQLTTDKDRPEALRFYKKLGFKNSHEGLKLYL